MTDSLSKVLASLLLGASQGVLGVGPSASLKGASAQAIILTGGSAQALGRMHWTGPMGGGRGSRQDWVPKGGSACPASPEVTCQGLDPD